MTLLYISVSLHLRSIFFFFFFNDTASTEIYTLSLHDALPIFLNTFPFGVIILIANILKRAFSSQLEDIRDEYNYRSEERFSRNAETDLVCRLLLEKKKNTIVINLLLESPFTDASNRTYVNCTS